MFNPHIAQISVAAEFKVIGRFDLMECFIHILVSLLIPVSYIVFIYTFDNGVESNYHPSSCKKRFLAAACNNVLSIALTWFLLSRNYELPFEKMGFHYHGWAYAAFFPALLTMTIYIGSIADKCIEGTLHTMFSLEFWNSSNRLMWVKYTLVGPISEEIAFRSCVAVLIDHCLCRTAATFICPLLFAVCHLHHVWDDLKSGDTLAESLANRGFQIIYTYLFGIYATFLFFASGHIISPIISHIICNCFGLPNLFKLKNCDSHRHSQLLFWNAVGFLLWIVSFSFVTSPSLYV